MSEPQKLTAEEQSKDRYFKKLASIAEEMIAEHGKEFTTGAFVLAARWVAENRFSNPEDAVH